MEGGERKKGGSKEGALRRGEVRERVREKGRERGERERERERRRGERGGGGREGGKRKREGGGRGEREREREREKKAKWKRVSNHSRQSWGRDSLTSVEFISIYVARPVSVVSVKDTLPCVDVLPQLLEFIKINSAITITVKYAWVEIWRGGRGRKGN